MQICRYTDIQVYRYTDIQICRYTVIQINTDIQIYRYTDIQIYRYSGIQLYRYTDIQICRYTDIQINTDIQIFLFCHVTSFNVRNKCPILYYNFSLFPFISFTVLSVSCPLKCPVSAINVLYCPLSPALNVLSCHLMSCFVLYIPFFKKSCPASFFAEYIQVVSCPT